MSQDRTNTTAFIEAQQYSKFIIENLPEKMLPDTFTRDVSDFGSGTTLNIKTVGAASIQDVAEGVPMTFNAIDTGTVTLSITDYIGDAWFISDELREDGAQVEQLHALRGQESTRAINENVETKFLAACNDAQTANNSNTVNGAYHRIVANGTNRVITLEDFAYMNFAFNKARAPQGGRVAIVDPSIEMTLNTLTNLVNVSNNPMFEGVVTEGFAKEHKFLRNIYGWDIWTSNLLKTTTSAEASLTDYEGNTTAGVIGDVANVFMCVADDNCRPIMRAWRRMPSAEGWRDPDNRQDKFQVSARFGFGAQRDDTLGIVLTDPTKF